MREKTGITNRQAANACRVVVLFFVIIAILFFDWTFSAMHYMKVTFSKYFCQTMIAIRNRVSISNFNVAKCKVVTFGFEDLPHTECSEHAGRERIVLVSNSDHTPQFPESIVILKLPCHTYCHLSDIIWLSPSHPLMAG